MPPETEQAAGEPLVTSRTPESGKKGTCKGLQVLFFVSFWKRSKRDLFIFSYRREKGAKRDCYPQAPYIGGCN